ncbi:MAG: nucleotidyl transferase AbiEii/AbiGii toxin family protein [Candidatus Zixiibacteriota bacterium]
MFNFYITVMDLEKITRIKEIAIKAMFSDDYLMDVLVLKGGNALDIIYKIAQRSSIDLDFSMESEFPEDKRAEIEGKIETLLIHEFEENDFEVFDIIFRDKPPIITDDMKDFWGGYEITFKILDKSKKLGERDNLENRRRNAEPINHMQHKVFKIDISKYEFCTGKVNRELDDLTIFLYSPTMIAIEKLRAICQQTDEYRNQVKSHEPVPRARDFFDIYTIIKNYNIDLYSNENITLLKNIFSAKKVDLHLLNEINRYKALHKSGFQGLLDTLKSDVKAKSFDHYFNYVIAICKKLKSLRII